MAFLKLLIFLRHNSSGTKCRQVYFRSAIWWENLFNYFYGIVLLFHCHCYCKVNRVVCITLFANLCIFENIWLIEFPAFIMNVFLTLTVFWGLGYMFPRPLSLFVFYNFIIRIERMRVGPHDQGDNFVASFSHMQSQVFSPY